MKKYSVSLVYEKPNYTTSNVRIDHALRCIIVEANSEDEALGKALKNFNTTDKSLGLLSMSCVIEIGTII